MSETLYTAVATSTGDGRAGGHVVSSDGNLDLVLAVPTEMGGRGGGTNPEQLFAAGWSACFHSALKAVAAAEKITLTDSAVVADISIFPNGQGGYDLGAALHVEIADIEQAEAERLVGLAHQVCPYSNATRGNIKVEIETVVA
ncbi:organic hydroperoxide resistance protein [Mycetocola lacteus]|uniref:Organic hydroperoxide resistance protein n=1 Tax=Mycetocola lacteus TaxID=76637 RepID=A0A3L7AJU3_9MICO|nr:MULTISPECIES: organic hydroperoxide resistance protein [Mycetocola]MCS4276834.1 Ohr subfamily peroxiredoxin [Mycetocola sp. BIGb0189]RLP79871.1 organic hydroperoxide resistance protein [Mycetocola lacteus]